MTSAPGPELLSGSTRRHRKEALIRGLFFAAAATSVVISAAIILSLIRPALTFFLNEPISNLFASQWSPRRGDFGLPTIIAGTLVISLIAMVVATPLGLGAAIYLSEHAHPRIRRILKPVLEILAGIPSIVMAFFALTFINPELVQSLFSEAGAFTLLAAGIGVGILVTPLVASVAEDAMHAVPGSLREASAGLGAPKRTTSLRVVFPAAVSGVVAALIIGISRAVGETMVVAVAAGGSGGAAFTLDPLDAGQTMTGAMASLATGSDQVKGVALIYESLFAVGALLFVMTFTLNVISERFVRRVRARY